MSPLVLAGVSHPFMRRFVAERFAGMDGSVEDLVVQAYGGSSTDLKYLGSGGEGFVFYSRGEILKFLVNWKYPKRDLPATLDNLLDFSARLDRPNHLYDIHTSRRGDDCLLVRYPARPGRVLSPAEIERRWSEGLRHQLRCAIEELAGIGYVCTDPSPGNFVLDGDTMMFCDYGSDIRPLRRGVIDIAEMHYTRKLKKSGRYLWRYDT